MKSNQAVESRILYNVVNLGDYADKWPMEVEIEPS